jgi:flagellum-specific ATP synthase
MNDIDDPAQVTAANTMRNLMSVYESNYDLISIGAYKKGANPALDSAISKIDKINSFLQQITTEKFEYDQTVELMKKAIQ